MICRVIFDGEDVSDTLMRNEASRIKSETQDDEGKFTMGDMQLKFSNMTSFFTDYAGVVDPVPVELWIAQNRLFGGVTESGGLKINPDNETCDCAVISNDHSAVETLKNFRVVSDLARLKCDIHAETLAGSGAEGRMFARISDILTSMLLSGIPHENRVNGVDLSTYFLGGVKWNSTQQPQLDMSGYEFVQSVAVLFNALFYMENGVLVLKDKRSFLHSSDIPLDLPILRGTLGITNTRCGLDRISFAYANVDRTAVSPYPGMSGEQVIDRDISPAAIVFDRVLEKKCGFRHAKSPKVYWYPEIATISRDDDNPLYLIRRPGSGTTIYDSFNVTPMEALQPWYEDELKGLTEWTATYSIMDNEAVLPELVKPYRKIVHPLGADGSCFIRSVEIDPDAETAKITAIWYAL